MQAIWKPKNPATGEPYTDHPYYGHRVAIIGQEPGETFTGRMIISVIDCPELPGRPGANKHYAYPDELDLMIGQVFEYKETVKFGEQSAEDGSAIDLQGEFE